MRNETSSAVLFISYVQSGQEVTHNASGSSQMRDRGGDNGEFKVNARWKYLDIFNCSTQGMVVMIT